MKPLTWYVVSSQGQNVLGVFGENLRTQAEECARRIVRDTGFPAFVHTYCGVRPEIGSGFSPQCDSLVFSSARGQAKTKGDQA